MRKGAFMGETVKEMNNSAENETPRKCFLKNLPTRLEEGGFHKRFARVEHCLHERIDYLTPNARASIFESVFVLFRGVPNSTRKMAFQRILY